jgi:hypothetical protein
MSKSHQEQTAWRFQSFNTENSEAGYECELPPRRRTQLLSGAPPKRPRILGRSQPAQANPAAKGWLLLGVLLAVITVGGMSTTWHEAAKPSSQPTSESISQPARTPQPAPPVVAPAPRATFVKLPPPRAQLIRLPQWKVDTERQLLMPYGLKVSGHLRGSVASTDMLPANGNQLGDTWGVGDTAWV